MGSIGTQLIDETIPLEASSPRESGSTLSAYLELTKPRITFLVVITAAAGFCLGSRTGVNFTHLLYLSAAIALLCSGIGTLNQYIERDLDGLMFRTRSRPLPAGRIQSGRALAFGVILSLAGLATLAVLVNWITAGLGILTLAAYLFGYTPLKTRSSLSTVVGAFPGAMPPMIGWAAATGKIGIEGLVLFAILFLWQFPHFLAIAWMYRDDYARAGIKMLPVVEPDGRVTGQQIVSYTLMLLPVSLLPGLVNLAGSVYMLGALGLGVIFLYFGARAAVIRSKWQARRLLQASVLYLPALFILMVLNP